MKPTNNQLIHGDNLDGLRYLLDIGFAGAIDLCYIDPPFSTGNNFTVTEGRNSTASPAKNGNVAYSDKLSGKSFLDFLRERLLLIRQLLSDRGSIYLHIDYKIGHYIKVMMDEVFGIQHFRNDITRIKCNPKNFGRTGYGNIKDLILFYSKGGNPIWNEPKEKYTEKELKRLFRKRKDGRPYTTVPLHAPGETENGSTGLPFRGILPPEGRHWRTNIETLEQWDRLGLIEWSKTGNPRKIIFADEKQGKRVQDIWNFKDPPYPVYPTEKNQSMLDLIIQTSSNQDSTVLDCFSGSGTTLKSAQESGRNWIGMDNSALALRSIMDKLGRIGCSVEAGSYDLVCLASDWATTSEKTA